VAEFRKAVAAKPDLVSQRTLFQLQESYVQSLGELWTSDVQLQNYLLTDGLSAPKCCCEPGEINLPTGGSGSLAAGHLATIYLTVGSFVVLWEPTMVHNETNPVPRLMRWRILFLAFLSVGLSLSMGAPDVSETAYDESEPLFCECTSEFSITEAGSVTAAPGVPSPACRFRLGDLRHRLAHETGSGHQRSESFTIRSLALRC